MFVLCCCGLLASCWYCKRFAMPADPFDGLSMCWFFSWFCSLFACMSCMMLQRPYEIVRHIACLYGCVYQFVCIARHVWLLACHPERLVGMSLPPAADPSLLLRTWCLVGSMYQWDVLACRVPCGHCTGWATCTRHRYKHRPRHTGNDPSDALWAATGLEDCDRRVISESCALQFTACLSVLRAVCLYVCMFVWLFAWLVVFQAGSASSWVSPEYIFVFLCLSVSMFVFPMYLF